jgi:hypothetical protein
MPQFIPLQVDIALTQLRQAIEQIDGRPIDVLKTPWSEIERSVIKLLGGAFRVDRPEHQAIALGLAGIFGARLQQEHDAFWFPNREALEGASLGFANALMVLAPFTAVLDALSRANLPKLDAVSKEIGLSLSQVRFSGAQPAGAVRLTPEDYQRLFDPGFIQFVSLIPAKAKAGWESTPERLSRDIRDALTRLPQSFPAETRKRLEMQLITALTRLDAGKSLADQAERAPQVVELMGHLFGTTSTTGSAPEELWHDVIFPLLYVGSPAQFPPLDEKDLAAYREGLDPLLLFVDLIPYQMVVPDHGALGVFAPDEVTIPHPALERANAMRLLKVSRQRLEPALQAFDPAKTRDALKRFTAYLEEKGGKVSAELAPRTQLLEASLKLLSDLKSLVATAAKDSADLCMRHLTEAEAVSEGAMDAIRRALQGPRIILLS